MKNYVGAYMKYVFGQQEMSYEVNWQCPFGAYIGQ